MAKRPLHPFWIGLPVGVVVAAVALVLLLRKGGETLTTEVLAAARERWAAEGPKDYDLRIEITGAQEGSHRVEVRRGVVVNMTTGGAAVPPRVWPSWSVEGLFRFLETELENAERPARPHGVDSPDQVLLRAEFDGDLGYPRRFVRHVQGTTKSIEWEITAFEPR
mgnify:FL=1